MSSDIQLRIRYPDGASSVIGIPESSTISDLKQQILSVVKVRPPQLVLRAGYPPTPLNHPDNVNLSEAQITSGDTLIVEIHSDEESQIEQKPSTSEYVQNQPKPNTVSGIRTVAKPPITTNQTNHNVTQQYASEEVLLDSDEEIVNVKTQRMQHTGTQNKQADLNNNKRQTTSNVTRGGSGVVTRQNNLKNPISSNAELMKSDLQAYKNKISGASNSNYKNGGSGGTNTTVGRKTADIEAQKHIGDEHGTTNLSKGRSKESAARKSRSHQDNTNSAFIDLTGEDIQEPRQTKKLKHDVSNASGENFERKMTQEEYDVEYARLLQESFESPRAQELLEKLEREKKIITEAQKDNSHSQTRIAEGAKHEKHGGKKVVPISKNNDNGTKGATSRSQRTSTTDYDNKGLGRQVRITSGRNAQQYDNSSDFYDITQQYYEENNLPIDPPKRNRTEENVYAPSHVEGAIQEDEDEMLQKTIQESFMQSKKNY